MSILINEKIKLAIDTAEKVLNDLDIKDAPVDIKKIAEFFKIDIKPMLFSNNDISGAIKIKGRSGNPVVVVNKEHILERQRFTIAHEIGHFLLHGSDINEMHIDAASPVYFRDGNAVSSTTDIKEMQANQFAAELLMPREMLAKDLLGEYKMRNDDDYDMLTIEKLAKNYKVSKPAMIKRVGSLIV